MCQPIPYSKFQNSEFYNFFNLTEDNFAIFGENDKFRQYFIKPGGFQEHIDILIVTTKDLIINASLVLDREWIGNKKHLSPFANDIT